MTMRILRNYLTLLLLVFASTVFAQKDYLSEANNVFSQERYYQHCQDEYEKAAKQGNFMQMQRWLRAAKLGAAVTEAPAYIDDGKHIFDMRMELIGFKFLDADNIRNNNPPIYIR